jgi:hypothetical protein
MRHLHSRASSIMALSGIVVLDSKNGCRAFTKRVMELGMSEFQRCRSSRSGTYRRYSITYDLNSVGVKLMFKGLWRLRVRGSRKVSLLCAYAIYMTGMNSRTHCEADVNLSFMSHVTFCTVHSKVREC